MKKYIVKKYSNRIEWYYNNKLDRDDGPAIEYSNGTKYWYRNGERHRLDEPAVEYSDGSKEWWLNGQLHRLNGPAIEYVNGDKVWYKNGQCHRLDGPAVENASGTKSWYVEGKKSSKVEVMKIRKAAKEKLLKLLTNNIFGKTYKNLIVEIENDFESLHGDIHLMVEELISKKKLILVTVSLPDQSNVIKYVFPAGTVIKNHTKITTRK